MNYCNIFTAIGTLQKPPVNNPGICLIQFCRWEDVAVWPTVDPLTGILNSSIQLKPGVEWNLLFAPNSDRTFSEQQQQSSAGPYYKVQVTGYLPGNDQPTVQKVAAMAYFDYVLLVTDRDGLIRLIGDEDTGAEFSNTYKSGDASASRRRDITFTWETPNPCPIYPGNDGLDGQGILTEDGTPITNEDGQLIIEG